MGAEWYFEVIIVCLGAKLYIQKLLVNAKLSRAQHRLNHQDAPRGSHCQAGQVGQTHRERHPGPNPHRQEHLPRATHVVGNHCARQSLRGRPRTVL